MLFVQKWSWWQCTWKTSYVRMFICNLYIIMTQMSDRWYIIKCLLIILVTVHSPTSPLIVFQQPWAVRFKTWSWKLHWYFHSTCEMTTVIVLYAQRQPNACLNNKMFFGKLRTMIFLWYAFQVPFGTFSKPRFAASISRSAAPKPRWIFSLSSLPTRSHDGKSKTM